MCALRANHFSILLIFIFIKRSNCHIQHDNNKNKIGWIDIKKNKKNQTQVLSFLRVIKSFYCSEIIENTKKLLNTNFNKFNFKGN